MCIAKIQYFLCVLCFVYRLMTSAGWNDVLESLMIQPPDCDINKETSSNGDCGHPLLAITYFTSFIIISELLYKKNFHNYKIF
jgi:hypothetical protein